MTRHTNCTWRGWGGLEKVLFTPGSKTPLFRPQWGPFFPSCDTERPRSVKFRKHMIFIWKNCENECDCVYLCFTPLSKPRGLALLASCRPISTPQKPEQCCHGPAVCLTLSYWIQMLRLGGREVRMGFDSFWRVHLLNLWTFWMMFRLGRWSKHWPLVLEDPLAGWDLYYWNTERSEAKLCILSGPQCWLANSFNGESLNKHGKGQKLLGFKETEMCKNAETFENCCCRMCVQCRWRWCEAIKPVWFV